MRLTFDPDHTIAYIALRGETEEVETIVISDELPIDLAQGGTVYGIELLNTNEQLTGARPCSPSSTRRRRGRRR